MNSTLRSAVALTLGIVLLTGPLAPLTGAQGARDQRQAAQDVTTSIADGNVEQARQAYQTNFASAASNATPLDDEIPAMIDAAPNATPDQRGEIASMIGKGLAGVAATQLADAENATAEDVREWGAVLFATFDEEILPFDEGTFENRTSEDAQAAARELAEGVRDEALAEALHELQETPELVEAGDTDEGQHEAREARGYVLVTAPAIAQVLDHVAARDLLHEIDEIHEFAGLGEADAIRNELDAVENFFAAYELAGFPAEKLEAFEETEHAVEDGNVTEARAAYEAEFEESFAEYATWADESVQTAFSEAENGSAAIAKARVEAALVGGTFEVGYTELAEAEFHETAEYMVVPADEFAWSSSSDTGRALGLALVANANDDATLSEVKTAASSSFVDKVNEEVAEVQANTDPTTRQAKAVEALVFAQPARSHFVEQLDQAPTDELFSELEELVEATATEDEVAASEAIDEIEKLLNQIDAEEGASNLSKAVTSLVDKIEFVAEEYRGYYEAKSEGDTSEAETEIGEAESFARSSLDTMKDNRDGFAAVDAQATDEIISNLEAILTALDEKAPLGEVTDRVNTTVELLRGLQAAEASADGPVVVQLGPIEASDTGSMVPVRLLHLPEGGFGFEAAVTYPDAVTVDRVEIPTEVGAENHVEAERTIEFNAASTSASGNVTVAEIYLEQADPVTDGFDVEVGTLADAQGDPIGVRSVNATPSAGLAGSQAPAPMPGVVGALVALVTGAVLVASRRR